MICFLLFFSIKLNTNICIFNPLEESIIQCMPFIKGKSGNQNGRTKGIPNKVTTNVRKLVSELIGNNLDKLQQDFDRLSPRDRVNATIKLLDFVLPKKFDLDVQAEISLKKFLELPVSKRNELLTKINEDYQEI